MYYSCKCKQQDEDVWIRNKKLITRWDSERELFYDDIVHALQNNNIYGSIAEVCYHAIHC